MMFRLPMIAALFACLITPIPLAAAEADTGSEAVTTFFLDNGLQVVVVEDHRAPAVQQMIWYRAGSADEPKGASGVAHFLEHLLFKATENMEAGEFSATVAANGGRDNAFTSYDYTAYFQRVAVDRLELMMRMEADRMTNIRLTEEDIRTERGVIIEERNQRTENSPGALFNEQVNAAQYLNHSYGVPIIGWRHEMETLGMEDVMAFYDRFYAPNNAILVISGDVKPEEVRRLAETYYGPIPANPDLKPRTRTEEPPQIAERRLTYSDPRVAQPYVTRSYLAQERDPGAQETAAALTMLAEILGGGTTSFLADKLQFDTQIATYTGAFYRGGTLDDTTFDMVVVPAAGISLEQAEEAMDEALAAFMETGVDPEQLDRIKLQIRADQIYARDDAERVANRYGQALSIGLTVEDVQEWPAILDAVTADDIMQAAEDVFDRRRSVTGYLMKAEAAE